MKDRPEARPVERREKVRAVDERVRRGEYRVPADAVADAVIDWYRRVEPGEFPTQK